MYHNRLNDIIHWRKTGLLLSLLILILAVPPEASSEAESVGLIQNESGSFKGYTLFAPVGSLQTHLIDINGEIVYSWKTEFPQATSAYLMENGNLIRTTAFGRLERGGFQVINPEGVIIWEFEYPGFHHDIEPLPNGNVLMIADEIIPGNEAIEAGRDPKLLGGTEADPLVQWLPQPSDNELTPVLWSPYIVEVQQTGLKSGTIIWEWHLWDHLVQDYDTSKSNFGVISEHPELFDVNVSIGSSFDWIHANSIDHNPKLDQILLTARWPSEIWVIDHSTTTKEAASNSGGNSGMGGDILYRWGSPQNYGRGTPEEQQLFSPHDGGWIPDSFPGASNILIFNNGDIRQYGLYSSVIEITPPIDQEIYVKPQSESSFLPNDPIWKYTAQPPSSFYAPASSSAQRLQNGNTLVCNGLLSTLFEVTSEGETVWKYKSPPFDLPPISKRYLGNANIIFDCHRYAPDYPGIQFLEFNDREGNDRGNLGIIITSILAAAFIIGLAGLVWWKLGKQKR